MFRYMNISELILIDQSRWTGSSEYKMMESLNKVVINNKDWLCEIHKDNQSLWLSLWITG